MGDRRWRVEVMHENGISYGFEVGSIRKIGKFIQPDNGDIANIKMKNMSVSINEGFIDFHEPDKK